MKNLILALAAFAFMSFGTAQAGDHKGDMTPSTVIHVVTVSWKPDASEENIQKALDGVKELAKAYDGIKRVWIKTLKAQGNRSHAFVMEFKDEQALKDYAGSPEQKAWYKVYYPVREGSTTFDITN
jgi:antibiotic biosynthesis monooxygenase (ABM) superfamily enzyme